MGGGAVLCMGTRKFPGFLRPRADIPRYLYEKNSALTSIYVQFMD
jgi:hypothetical protein